MAAGLFPFLSVIASHGTHGLRATCERTRLYRVLRADRAILETFSLSFFLEKGCGHTVRAVTQRMADLGLSFDLIDFEAEVDKGFSHKFVDWCFFSL